MSLKLGVQPTFRTEEDFIIQVRNFHNIGFMLFRIYEKNDYLFCNYQHFLVDIELPVKLIFLVLVSISCHVSLKKLIHTFRSS